jgi:hypothetical protein
MLKIVTDIVIAVIASLRTKLAVPNEAGLAAPVAVVGTVGGFSAASVILAVRIVAAWQYVPATMRVKTAIALLVFRNIVVSLLIDSPRLGFVRV